MLDLLNAASPLAGLARHRGLVFDRTAGLALDLYVPEIFAPSGERAPVVVFFYGGSWRGGARADYRFAAAGLARLGAVVAVPDYRVYPQVRFPDFLTDCAAAVGFIAGVAARYGADPGRIFLAGHSAGAYNAMMLALDPIWLAAQGLSPSRLAGTIGLAGPYDFLPMTGPDIRAVFGPAADTPISQPIHFVRPGAPSALLIAGARDRRVAPRNTASLAARLRACGVAVETRCYRGIGHVGVLLALAPALRWLAPSARDIARFLAPRVLSADTAAATGPAPAI